jgi:hypothetical protein
MEGLLSIFTPEMLLLFLINLFLILLLFIFHMGNRAKIRKMKDKYNRFMSGLSDRNMEELLEQYIQRVNEVSNKNREMENHINHIERDLLKCVQKVGIIRFNAFDNVGSDLSFAIALLDNNDTGIVISGIYARDSSSTYAKPIIGSRSRYTLSAEEIQALDIAKKSSMERVYTDKQ